MSVPFLAGNVAILLLADVFCKVLVAIYTVLIVRYLGAQGFGVLSLGFAYMGIFALLADLGLNSVLVRELAKDISIGKRLLGVVNSLKMVALVIGSAVLLLCNFLFGYSQETFWVILLCFVGMGVGAFWMSCSAVFQSQGAMGYVAAGQMLDAVLVLGGFPIAVYGQLDVVGVAFLLLWANVVTLVYGFLFSEKKFLPVRFHFDQSLAIYLFKQVAPLSICVLCASVVARIGPIFLSVLVENASIKIGWYSVAMKFVIALAAVPSAISITLLPFWSRQFQTGNEKTLWDQTAPLLLKYLTAAGCFGGIYLLSYPEELIRLVFGPDYEPASSVLRILGLGVPVSFVLAVFGPFMIATHRQRMLGYVAGANLLCVVALNLLLIPHFQHQAIAVAPVFADGICLCFWFFYFAKRGFQLSLFSAVIKPGLAAVCFCAVYWVFFRSHTVWWAGFFLEVLLYGLFLFLFRVISVSEMKKVYAFFVRSKP